MSLVEEDHEDALRAIVGLVGVLADHRASGLVGDHVELLDFLRPAVFEDLEIFDAKARGEAAVPVEDDGVDLDKRRRRSKRRLSGAGRRVLAVQGGLAGGHQQEGGDDGAEHESHGAHPDPEGHSTASPWYFLAVLLTFLSHLARPRRYTFSAKNPLNLVNPFEPRELFFEGESRMRFRLVGTTLLAVPLITALAAPAPQQQKTALVTVVAEAAGPVAGLTATDFVVREDKATREVVAAERSGEPLFITLLVDTTQPPMGILPPIQDFRRALSSFVSIVKAASPDAQIAIMEFAGASVTSVDFTTEAPALDKFIQRVFLNRQSDAVLIEAMVDAGKKLSDKPSPRRAIVSVDFNSRDTSAEKTMRQAADTIRKAGSTVWAVSIRGTGGSSSAREEVLNVVTRGSGGMRLTGVEATGLEPMLKSVANSLLSQYTVTFTRPGSGEVKSTEMETRKGGKVLLTPWMR